MEDLDSCPAAVLGTGGLPGLEQPLRTEPSLVVFPALFTD